MSNGFWLSVLQNAYGEWENIDSDMTGFIAFCGVLGKLHEINLSGCQLGPTSVAELGKAVSIANASIARISVLSNPIGVEGATALIDVYERNENLRTLLGIEEGATELNLAKKQVDPGQAMVLAKELQTGRVTTSIKAVNLSKCALTGATWNDLYERWDNPDSDMTGFIAYCDVLGKLHEINLNSMAV